MNRKAVCWFRKTMAIKPGQVDANGKAQGCAPGGGGLLIIDFINTLDFDGAEPLKAPALKAAKVAAELRKEATRLGVPVVYVNDNYGQWRSERDRIIDDCAQHSEAAHELVSRLRPAADDYFIIKPQFSGFYATNLAVLLPQLGVSRLILTGIAAEICVLFTAADAHMRAYDLWIPRDAVASADAVRRDQALEIMERSMGATIAPTAELAIAEWLGL